MLIKKKNTTKTTQEIESDIRYGFHKLISQNSPLYAITINHTGSRSVEELRFQLTNKLFNRIHKDYDATFENLDYLFIVEYPTKVSMGNQLPTTTEVHAHIVLASDLSPHQLDYYINTTFRQPYIFKENITKRDDKENLLEYLLKQKHLFTNDNYNYKIKTKKVSKI